MRIITVDLRGESDSPCDIEGPLQRLAAEFDTLSAIRWQKLLELVRALRADGPNPTAWGLILGEELQLSPPNPANRASARIWVDWRDYGPVENGLPVMHYRIQVQRPGSRLSAEVRTADPDEVRQVIWEAFGWVR